MRILITGGAGFIGSNLGHHLAKQKHEVLLIDNLSFGYLENIDSYHTNNANVKPVFIQMDIRNPKIEKVLKNVDVVFHFAGISSLPECQNNPSEACQINTAGTVNILEAARRNNVKRIIFSSTSAVYENESSFPTKEKNTTSPTLIYGLSKKHAEEICHSYQELYKMDIVILRFFNTYGPYMDLRRPNPSLISYIIRCFIENEIPILHSNGKQARDMIYVDDVISLCEIVTTHKKARNQIFNVGSGKSHKVQDVYLGIMKAFEKKGIKPNYRTAKLLWSKYPQLFRGDHPFQTKFLEKEVNKYTLADITKAKKLLNWSPKVNLKEGLQKTVAFSIKNK